MKVAGRGEGIDSRAVKREIASLQSLNAVLMTMRVRGGREGGMDGGMDGGMVVTGAQGQMIEQLRRSETLLSDLRRRRGHLDEELGKLKETVRDLQAGAMSSAIAGPGECQGRSSGGLPMFPPAGDLSWRSGGADGR